MNPKTLNPEPQNLSCIYDACLWFWLQSNVNLVVAAYHKVTDEHHCEALLMALDLMELEEATSTPTEQSILHATNNPTGHSRWLSFSLSPSLTHSLHVHIHLLSLTHRHMHADKQYIHIYGYIYMYLFLYVERDISMHIYLHIFSLALLSHTHSLTLFHVHRN